MLFRSRKVAFISDEPASSILGLTVKDELELLTHGNLKQSYELAMAVGLQHKYCQAVSTLSGGEIGRLVLATCLAEKSRHLLLDDATRHVDEKSCEDYAAKLSSHIKDQKLSLVVSDKRLLAYLGKSVSFSLDLTSSKRRLSTTENSEVMDTRSFANTQEIGRAHV